MSILDYFDIHNKEHLKAYKFLQSKGHWSEAFWSNIFALDFPMNWQVVIMSRLATEYVKEKLNVKS